MPHVPAGREAHRARQRRSGRETLKRDNVHLVTDGIKEITPTASSPPTASEHPADVIIYGTGFQASRVPDADEGHRAATASTSTSSGTATRARTLASPCRTSRTSSCSTARTRTSSSTAASSTSPSARCSTSSAACACCFEGPAPGARAASATCTTRTTSASTRRTCSGRGALPTVNSWYKNENGRVSQNWPFNLIEYWQQTREPDAGDYEFL